jgi:hypothetical protein
MIVRFFDGWSFASEDMRSRDPAFAGYAKGVPMGGDLGARAGDLVYPDLMNTVSTE